MNTNGYGNFGTELCGTYDANGIGYSRVESQCLVDDCIEVG